MKLFCETKIKDAIERIRISLFMLTEDQINQVLGLCNRFIRKNESKRRIKTPRAWNKN